MSCGDFFSPHWVCYKSNRENSELSFIAYRFQPHPLACTKVQLSIRGVGSVIATKVPFNCGLACVPAACLAEVLFLFSLGVAQILNSNGLNGKNLSLTSRRKLLSVYE